MGRKEDFGLRLIDAGTRLGEWGEERLGSQQILEATLQTEAVLLLLALGPSLLAPNLATRDLIGGVHLGLIASLPIVVTSSIGMRYLREEDCRLPRSTTASWLGEKIAETGARLRETVLIGR